MVNVIFFTLVKTMAYAVNHSDSLVNARIAISLAFRQFTPGIEGGVERGLGALCGISGLFFVA